MRKQYIKYILISGIILLTGCSTKNVEQPSPIENAETTTEIAVETVEESDMQEAKGGNNSVNANQLAMIADGLLQGVEEITDDSQAETTTGAETDITVTEEPQIQIYNEESITEDEIAELYSAYTAIDWLNLAKSFADAEVKQATLATMGSAEISYVTKQVGIYDDIIKKTADTTISEYVADTIATDNNVELRLIYTDTEHNLIAFELSNATDEDMTVSITAKDDNNVLIYPAENQYSYLEPGERLPLILFAYSKKEYAIYDMNILLSYKTTKISETTLEGSLRIK